MSREKQPANDGREVVSTRDLFGSIPRPLDVDPFEGIDIDSISLYMKPSKEAEDADEEIVLANPIEGIDVFDITGKPESKKKAEEGFSLEGIDPYYISVKADPHQDYRLPAEEEDEEKLSSEKETGTMQRSESASAPASKGGENAAPGWFNLGRLSSWIKPFGRNLTKRSKPFSKPPRRALPAGVQESPSALAGRLRNGYVYSEVNRIRENVVAAVEKENKKTVAFTSPHDDVGATFLITLLGFNVAYFTSMKTLLVDLNMRRPQLHIPFNLEQEKGFTEVAAGFMKWEDAVKDTGLSELKMLTAGKRDNELYLTLTPSFIEEMIQGMKKQFDLILFDTSPLLNQNKNNVDPVFLSLTCDLVVMVVQDKVTTIDQLTEAVSAITRDGGKVDGVVYNHQF